MSNPATLQLQRTTDNGQRTNHSRWTLLIVPIFLCGLAWFAHFSDFRQMGFYEDDHYFAARTMVWTPHDAVDWVRVKSKFPGEQGRPVGFILGGILPYVGYHIDGVPGMYLVGFAIFALNANLFYFLLRRCLREPMPVVGAIAFILFPADTTRPFLNHEHILQPAIGFTLAACHLYMNKGITSRVLAYVLALMTLLSYETAVLPLIFFPLLMRRWDLRWLTRFAVHGLVMAGMLVTIGEIRSHFGEARAKDALKDRQTVLFQIEQGTRIGLDTVKTVCRFRANQGKDEVLSQPAVRPAVVVCGLSTLGAVFWAVVFTDRRRNYRMLFPEIGRAAAYSAAALAISYTLSFTHYPPTYQLGRMTSTHLATTLPVSVLMAAVCSLPMLFPPKPWGALLCGGVAAVYFPFLFQYARYEQESYAAIWHARREFWTQVIDECPDLQDGTLIVVDGTIPRPEYYMDASSWSDYMIIAQAWDFRGKNFGRDPMAFCFRRNPSTDEPTWKTGITHIVGGPFLWHVPPDMGLEKDSPVFSGNTILLHADEAGRLTRQTGTIQLAGSDFKLKDPGPVVGYAKLPMYHVLTGR